MFNMLVALFYLHLILLLKWRPWDGENRHASENQKLKI